MALNIDDEWENFISSTGEDVDDIEDLDECVSANVMNETCPKASPIYISTKTNISYLNQAIDLKSVFWNIPVIPYAQPTIGVIKKQMKFNSLLPEELETIQERLKKETYVEENIITSINNPAGRIKFKDIRKISIGISRKDLMSYRCKKKSAFYNCFVVILRIKISAMFKEFHVKVFNTGKLEIPGIQTESAFQEILLMVIDILQPHVTEPLEYQKDTTMTVLINSNFNCGFFINRESLFDILKCKYNIQCIYDPCSYPGIQCKFYFDSEKGIQTGIQGISKTSDLNITDVSFMIFRTGSVLIVGKCDESVLISIYEFLKELLLNEFKNIGLKLIDQEAMNAAKDKKKKIRKKQIVMQV